MTGKLKDGSAAMIGCFILAELSKMQGLVGAEWFWLITGLFFVFIDEILAIVLWVVGKVMDVIIWWKQSIWWRQRK